MRAAPLSGSGLAATLVALTGAAWGLYWLPVRALAELGLTGAWGTVAITALTVLVLLPVSLWRGEGGAYRTAGRAALASVALGGAAFALYSVAFLYGRVALVVLLWFLTPVWSTLIARLVLRQATPPRRVAVIVLGLAGLVLMLGAGGQWPLPRSLGEWFGLAGGILWAVATTGIRARPTLPPTASAVVFAAGALAASLALLPLLAGGAPLLTLDAATPVAGLTLLAAIFWWGGTVIALIWAAQRLDSARVGLLLMTEVVVAAFSASLLAGERLTATEWAGGGLVMLAAALEIWPDLRRRSAADT